MLEASRVESDAADTAAFAVSDRVELLDSLYHSIASGALHMGYSCGFCCFDQGLETNFISL